MLKQIVLNLCRFGGDGQIFDSIQQDDRIVFTRKGFVTVKEIGNIFCRFVLREHHVEVRPQIFKIRLVSGNQIGHNTAVFFFHGGRVRTEALFVIQFREYEKVPISQNRNVFENLNRALIVLRIVPSRK